MNENELNDLAKQLHQVQGELKPSDIEDDVSLCDYCSRRFGVELTLDEAGQVRERLEALEN